MKNKKARRLRLWKEQNGLCYLCGEPMILDPDDYTNKKGHEKNPLSATLEHVYPQSLGGTAAKGNTRLAHKKCNEAKGALLSPDDDETR